MKHRLWTVAALSAGLAGAGAMPALGTDPLLFSLDGRTWVTELDESIFTKTPVLVPGAEVSAKFWVRNASTDTADLKVSLVSDWPEVGDNLDVLWVRAAMNGGAPVESGANVEPILLGFDGMEALESREVTVTVGLEATAGNSSQNLDRPIAFNVRLAQAIPARAPAGGGNGVTPPRSPVSPVPGTGSDVLITPTQPAVPNAPGGAVAEPKALVEGGPFGALPDTGFTSFWWAVVGSALTAGGLLALVCGRRTKNSNEEGSHGPA